MSYTFDSLFKNQEELKEFLLYAEFASGSYSTVYFINDTLCIKETTDKAYLLFVNKIYPENNNKHFVNIYDIKILDGVHYILMERLSIDNTEEIWQICMAAEEAGYWEKDISLWIGLSDSFDSALKTLDTWYDNIYKKHKIYYDLRFTNVLKRGNDFVIVDPWSTNPID